MLLKLTTTDSPIGSCILTISSTLHNIGTGPALQLRLRLRINRINDYGVTKELAPLEAGQEVGNRQPALLFLQFWLSDAFNAADVQFALGSMWELLIEYEDVFGNRFYTIYSKDPQKPWTVCGKGPAPPGVDPAVVNAKLQAMQGSGAARDDGSVGPGFGL